MTLLQPASNTSSFLKMGMTGLQGSGKTYTASSIAAGLVQMMRDLDLPTGKLPIAFFDTEKGSDWVLPRFKAAGIPLLTRKSRAFVDLITVMREAEQGCSVLIIDSLTHVWKEFCQAYLRKKNRSFLKFDDWSYLKGEDGWQKFTDAFINSNLHVIFAGRAGFEYDMDTDEETGKKTLEKTGIKLKAEGETGYEPDLFVAMERHQEIKGNNVVRAWRAATVIKDRSNLIDGKVFVDPTFDHFLPHIQCLNIGGRQMGVDTTASSESSIKTEKRDWSPVQRRIVIDEIQTLLVLHIPGQAATDKKRKAELIRKHFAASWTEIEEVMPLFDLRAGYDSLHLELEKTGSRYHTAAVSPAAPARTTLREELNDSLPDHSAPPVAADPVPNGSMGEMLRAYGHVNGSEVPYLLAT